MQIKGLISFKSSIEQAIASLYFLRISNSFCSSCSVNAAEIIRSFAFYGSKKAYFKCLGNSFKVNPSELVSISFASFSLLQVFYFIFCNILCMVSFFVYGYRSVVN